MTKTGERDVLDVDPANLENSFPLVGRPDVARRLVVDGREHLSHAGEVSTARREKRKVSSSSSKAENGRLTSR